MLNRIFLWVATNIAVIFILSVVLKVTGMEGALGGQSGYIGLLVAASVVGFTGSLISLLMSKWMAKRQMQVQIIDTPRNEFEAWYVSVVTRQAETLGLRTPEIGIFPSDLPNAFATGATKNSSLVAISTGLAQSMKRDEIEAVIGHEMAHVANGDMVTMMLLQGVINTFVIFLARVIAQVVTSRGSDNQSSSSGMYYLVSLVLQIVFGVLASLITCAFSRYREFRADAGGARLTSPAQMASALEALRRSAPSSLPNDMSALGINGTFSNLLSTHPPLEKRIEKLQHFEG